MVYSHETGMGHRDIVGFLDGNDDVLLYLFHRSLMGRLEDQGSKVRFLSGYSRWYPDGALTSPPPEQDPEIDLNIVTETMEDTSIDHIMSNGFGFGGHNSSVIISRFKD